MQWINGLCAALKTGLRALTPTCRQASRLQSFALDHSLPFLDRLGLVLHLLLCKWCRRYGRQLRFLRRAAHHHPETMTDTVAAALPAESRERLKESLRKAKDSPPGAM